MSNAGRSDKHGPRLDDSMKKQTEALERSGHDLHTEDWKEPEPAERDDVGRTGGTPPGMSPADVAGRSELARSIQPSVFPATGRQLTASAEETHAPDQVVRTLERLPQGRIFQNVQEVWETAGGGVEDEGRRF